MARVSFQALQGVAWLPAVAPPAPPAPHLQDELHQLVAAADVDGDGRVRLGGGSAGGLRRAASPWRHCWLCCFASTALLVQVSPHRASCVLPNLTQITIAEFVAATLGNSLQQREDFLRGLFQRFDTDGDQQITPSALGWMKWMGPRAGCCICLGVACRGPCSRPHCLSARHPSWPHACSPAAPRLQMRCSRCWRALG